MSDDRRRCHRHRRYWLASCPLCSQEITEKIRRALP